MFIVLYMCRNWLCQEFALRKLVFLQSSVDGQVEIFRWSIAFFVFCKLMVIPYLWDIFLLLFYILILVDTGGFHTVTSGSF